jgi:BirA family transcriptional regulator, biotin operon repressor / biotin---[acetyl-CoA-carboxylase] ligase
MTPETSCAGFIREVIELGSVDSTNTYALDAGRVGLLVIASAQTAGRGRHGRSWFSPEGRNIYLTLTTASTDPRLAIVTGVALHEAVLGLLAGKASLEIKWPNDLIADGKKLCGILCETRGSLTAVGVGLNVGGRSWPPELEGRATSIEEVLGAPLDRRQVLDAVIPSLDTWFGIFFTKGFRPVREEFLKHGLLQKHELATEQGEPCTIAGMGEDGHLILDLSGSRREIVSGTILVKS